MSQMRYFSAAQALCLASSIVASCRSVAYWSPDSCVEC